ncbi:MAG: glycosyltransferase family 2 protein, partial [Aerococcus suis]|nr:glycosyltransferase family 2 protein [Aerococcus suis]
MQPLLSIVVPCFNEEEMIPIFYDYLENIPLPLNREYIFVNDGSKDNSLQQMKRLKQLDPSHVHYVSFSRNFGKEAGIYAGLQYAAGDFVVLMDVDLQDPPELLPEMFNILTTTDYDCVGTRRLTREGEPPIRSFFSKKFYQVINKIS